MLSLPVLDSHRPPVRVMALHALAYCTRLFYLEEVEELLVIGTQKRTTLRV